MEEQSSLFNLTVTPSLRSTMKTVATWAKLCAIFAFISEGVSLLVSFKNGNLLGSVIATAIGVFMNILLLNFATKLQAALETNDEGLLTESFSNLRRYYLITGILMIIVAVIVLIALVFVIAFASKL